MKHWHTYKNTAKAKSVVPFLLFTLLMLLSSCNLFIEEEEVNDDYGFNDLPEYSGNGYDKPVTTTDGDCEVTYQLKKTVRMLNNEDTRHITAVRQDNSGLFMEIRYSALTPEDQLPVKGQILVSTDTETFPMGCMHRLQTMEKRDGEYCYTATLADLEETFDELDIRGRLNTTDEGSMAVEPEPDDNAEQTAAAPSTRAIGISGEMNVGYNEDGFWLTYDFPTEPFFKMSSPEVKKADIDIYFNEGSRYKETHSLNFDDFSLSRRSFKFQYNCDKDYDLSFHIGSKIHQDVPIKKFRLIKGRPFTVGPVVLVLFANLEFSFEGQLESAVDISRHIVTRTTVYFDLLHPLDLKKDNRVLSDTGWECSAMISGSAGLRAKLELCLGLYGKILSLRIAPSLYLGLTATVAPPVSEEDGVPVYDVSKKPGITPKFTAEIETGLYFELSFLDFFKGLFERFTSSNIGDAFDRLVKEANDNSNWYKEHSAKDQWTDQDLERFRRKENDNSSITHTFGPWNIAKISTTPWFPSIQDNSFCIETYFDELEKKMHFDARFTIEDAGFFSHFNDYVPVLMIIESGGKVVDYVHPDGEGSLARVESGKTYFFTLPAYYDDKTRVAKPSYYKTYDPVGKPVAIDKGLPFCSTSPKVSIIDVKPERAEIKEGNFMLSIWNKETDEYDYYPYHYEYNYFFDVSVSMRGAEHIRSWGLIEPTYYESYDYGEGMNKDIYQGNGTYTFHCILTVHSNVYDEKRPVDITLFPYYMLRDGTTIIPEESTRWTQYADGTYKKK